MVGIVGWWDAEGRYLGGGNGLVCKRGGFRLVALGGFRFCARDSLKRSFIDFGLAN